MVLGITIGRSTVAAGLTAFMLVAPSARADCAKSTAMRPCVRGGWQHPPNPRNASSSVDYYPRKQPRSVGLVVGGIGVILLSGVAGFFAYVAGVDSCGAEPTDHCKRGDANLAAASAIVGLVGVAGGAWMIYYGAKDRPRPAPPVSLAPWTNDTARGLSLRVRF